MAKTNEVKKAPTLLVAGLYVPFDFGKKVKPKRKRGNGKNSGRANGLGGGYYRY